MADQVRIKLTGYSDPHVVESIFASSLVDVAYIDQVTPNCIFVVAERDIDLGDISDFEWVKSVIEQVFEREGMHVVVDQENGRSN